MPPLTSQMATYKKYAPEIKLCVIQAARSSADWGNIALCHDVILKTTTHLVRRYGVVSTDVMFTERGGKRHSKVTAEHVEKLEVS